ncbi:hypothetical protein pb186bvf_009593 [Paramecium bursaria]
MSYTQLNFMIILISFLSLALSLKQLLRCVNQKCVCRMALRPKCQNLQWHWKTYFFGYKSNNICIIYNISKIDLDVYQLRVDYAYLPNGRILQHQINVINQQSLVQGDQLRIQLDRQYKKGEQIVLLIRFGLDQRARALGFLNPSQTVSKFPYVFSQCETNNCRSMLPIQDTPSFIFSYRSNIQFTQNNLQDAYSLRCVPQVLGASLQYIEYVKKFKPGNMFAYKFIYEEDQIIDIVYTQENNNEQEMIILDNLSISLSEIGGIAERRIQRLMNPKLQKLDDFYEQFADSHPYKYSQLANYASNLIQKNKRYCQPINSDSMPQTTYIEDINNCFEQQIKKLYNIIKNTEKIIKIDTQNFSKQLSNQSKQQMILIFFIYDKHRSKAILLYQFIKYFVLQINLIYQFTLPFRLPYQSNYIYYELIISNKLYFAIYNGKQNLINHIQMIIQSLRGGGGICSNNSAQVAQLIKVQTEKPADQVSPKQEQQKTNINEIEDRGLDKNQQKYLKLVNAIESINKLSVSLMSGKAEMKQSLQFIHLSEYWIYEIMQSKTLLNQMVELVQGSIHDLLQSARKLVKQDTQVTQQVLYIISLFLMMLFKFQISNSNRYISDELSKQWLDDIKGLENELSIERIQNSYRNQIDYECYVITSIVMVSNTDSNEGFEILKSMFIGIFKSVSSFPSISFDGMLQDAIVKGVFYLINQKIKQQYLARFQIIFVIEQFKWKLQKQMIQLLKKQIKIDDISSLISSLYEQLQVDQHWATLFCWMRMLSTILMNTALIQHDQIDQQMMQKYISNKLAICDSDQNLIIQIDKSFFTKDNEQFLKEQFQGLQELSYLHFYLVKGGSGLPEIDQYNIERKKMDDRIEKDQIILFIKQLLNNYKLQFNRIKKFDVFLRLNKFKNSLIMQVKNKKIQLKEIVEFYQPKINQIDIIIQQIQIQVYFFHHSQIIINKLLKPQYNKKSKYYTLVEQQQIVKSKQKELESCIFQLLEIKIQLSFLVQYAINNLKYNQNDDHQEQIQQLIEDLDQKQAQIVLIEDFPIFSDQYFQLIKKFTTELENEKPFEEENFLNKLQIISIQIPYIQYINFIRNILTYLTNKLKQLKNDQKQNQSQQYTITLQILIIQQILQISEQLNQLDIAYQDFRFQCQNLLNNEIFFQKKEQQMRAVDEEELIDNYENLKDNWVDRKLFNNAVDLVRMFKKYKRPKFGDLMDEINIQIKEILEIIDSQSDQKIWIDNLNALAELMINRLNKEIMGDTRFNFGPVRQKQLKKLPIDAYNSNQLEPFIQTYQNLLNLAQKDLVNWYIRNRTNQILESQNSSDPVIEINNLQKSLLQDKLFESFEVIHEGLSEEYLRISLDLNQDGGDRLQLLCIQTYQVLNNQLSRLDDELELTLFQKISKYKQQLFNDGWRVRQCIIQSLLKINQYCWSQEIQTLINFYILKFRVFETDKRIISILDDQQYINSLNEMYNKEWVTQQDKIQMRIKDEIQELNNLQILIQTQQDVHERQILLTEYSQKQIKIQEQLKNLENLGDQIGVSVVFLQDLKLDLLRMDAKLNKIMDNINEIVVDLQYLRGRTIYQMLQIRQDKILYQQKVMESQKIYIPLYVKEFNYTKGQEEKDTLLFTEKVVSDAEINEFIWGTNESKDTLLVHGLAGCGKSTAGKKVEEFIWKFNQTQQQLNIQITPLIPIAVSLPSLIDPTNQIIEQTLKSDNYNFDDKQINELKQAVEEGKIKLLIILDSFDEIKPNFQINLIKSNKLSRWRQQNDQGNYPKIIITARTEVLPLQDHYKLFLSEMDDLRFYKEIRLIEFDTNQINKYIQEYCVFRCKQIILEYSQQSNKRENLQEIMNRFYQIWSKVQFQMDSNKLYLIDEDEANKIVQLFKDNKNIQDLTQEKQRGLSVELQEVWGPKQYLRYIQSMQLNKILVTVFMMEIVIQVLPQMINQQNHFSKIQENFMINYLAKINNSVDQCKLIWEQISSNNNIMKKINISMTQKELSINLLKRKGIYMVNQYHSSNLTKYDFYETFFQIYIRKQLNKVIDDSFNHDQDILFVEILQFATKLANIFTQKNLTVVEYVPQGYLFQRKEIWQDEFFEDQNNEKIGQFKRIYRKCIPLKQKFNSFQFNHKSLQEFLVAKDIIRIIELYNKTQQIDEDIKESLLSLVNWETDFMKGSLDFLNQKLKLINNVNQIINQLIQSVQNNQQMAKNLQFIQRQIS